VKPYIGLRTTTQLAKRGFSHESKEFGTSSMQKKIKKSHAKPSMGL
jgi:hypothetical protein